MCNPKKITEVIRCLKAGLKQLPKMKQFDNLNKIDAILKKYPDASSQKQMQQLYKDLQFRLDFLKLAHPGIKFESVEKQQQQPANTKNPTIQSLLFQEQVDVKPKSKQELERQQFKESTTFVLKDGRLVPGEAPRREEVEFHNWAEGNADPQTLQKHKQLLDRQYFRGPVWQDKELPKPTMMSLLETINTSKDTSKIQYNKSNRPQQTTQRSKEELEARFEKIKR